MQVREVLKGALFLAGLIIGVGFFGLPYTAREAGFFVTAGFLVVATFLVSIIHLAFGEVVARTGGEHGIVGYVGIYLGPWGRRVALVSSLGGLGGSLLAYLIVGGEFLSKLIPFSSQESWAIILSVLGYFLVLKGLRLSSKVEIFITALLVASLLFISLAAFPSFDVKNFSLGSSRSFFLPYGVALFSLIGSAAIPDLVKLLGSGGKSQLKRAILFGTIVPSLLYLFFTAAVLGASGVATSPEALRGLASVLGSRIVAFGAFVGIMAVFTSYLIVALSTKRILVHDIGSTPFGGTALAVGVPLALYLLGFRSFISVIGVVGAVGVGVDGILLLWTLRQAQKMGPLAPPYSLCMRSWFLLLFCILFALGALFGALEISR